MCVRALCLSESNNSLYLSQPINSPNYASSSWKRRARFVRLHRQPPYSMCDDDDALRSAYYIYTIVCECLDGCCTVQYDWYSDAISQTKTHAQKRSRAARTCECVCVCTSLHRTSLMPINVCSTCDDDYDDNSDECATMFEHSCTHM